MTGHLKLLCAVTASGLIALSAMPANALTSQECSAKYQAAKTAGTLNGQSPAGLDLKTLTTMLLKALGEDDVDQMIEQLFPENWEEIRAEKAAKLMQMGQSALGKEPDGDEEDDDPALSAREARTLAELQGAVLALAEAVKEARDAA